VIAGRLARDGACVALAARDTRGLAEVVEELSAAGGDAAAFELDVRSVASIRKAVAEVEERLGPVDILVNNAGLQRLRLAVDVTEDDWDVVHQTNLRGAFFMAQAVGRGMVVRGAGSIVNVASMAAFKAVSERAAYNSSKAGLVMLTKTLAVEWGPHGVRVNAVAPTFIETEMGRLWLDRPGVRDRLLETIPTRRLPTAEEVAAAVAWLVSPEASSINGTILPVDGGVGVT
jgi:NAD(P)-dependent dehydrogenase (short-subunit alcohol dehydrogenase family)